jgi:Spy/CpxP family protein refolding chaperone
MKTISKIAIVTAGALVVVGSLAACSYHHDPEHRSQWMQEKVTKKLELNDTQQQQLKSVSDEMLNARESMEQQLGNDREQVLALLDQPTLDQDKVLDMIQSHTQAINEGAPGIVAALGDFYDKLSAEQQAEVREFVEEHRGHRGHWDH